MIPIIQYNDNIVYTILGEITAKYQTTRDI